VTLAEASVPPGWALRPPASVLRLADVPGACRTDVCRDLAEGYAAMAAAAGGVPGKRDFDPTLVRVALPHLSLMEVRGAERCLHRLVGEALKERLGFDPTGRDYYALLPPERRAVAARAHLMAVGVPCGFRCDIRQGFADGAVREVEAVAFPLVSDQPGVDGFVVVASRMVAGPRRLDPRMDPRFVGSVVVRRDLVDLGHGVDPAFRDVVPEGAPDR
jgi:hypothetical protein